MKLKIEELKNIENWNKANICLPKFDIEQVKQKTKKRPNWIHFGAGNIFRAFIANLVQKLLNENKSEIGIIASCDDTIDALYHPYDNLSLLAKIKSNGEIEKSIIASVVEAINFNSELDNEWLRLKEIFRNPTLQIVSFTITEKGYCLVDAKGNYLEEVESDFKNGPEKPKSYMGKIASLLYERFLNGELPISVVSMDNCSQNGMKLYEAINEYVMKWTRFGKVDFNFSEYINNPKKVAFPWTMIDKITPRPDSSVKEMLKELGFEDVENVITPRKSFVAPFVNAEEPEYLVIEDMFPNGRPKLEDAGVIFTTRETVENTEKMKVCTCLNPLHTALAIFGCLLGYELICDEMKDNELKKLVEKIGYVEGLPVVVNPKIIDPYKFIEEVLNIRFPNPFMPDTPQRIASDTSQKLAIRFGETIKAYSLRKDLDVKQLNFIPLVIAGWCRYLIGFDDFGNKMELSPDPMLEEVTSYVKNIKIGDVGPFSEILKPILSNKMIFGVDLYDVGLSDKIEKYFTELISEKGAIRATLKKYLK